VILKKLAQVNVTTMGCCMYSRVATPIPATFVPVNFLFEAFRCFVVEYGVCLEHIVEPFLSVMSVLSVPYVPSICMRLGFPFFFSLSRLLLLSKLPTVIHDEAVYTTNDVEMAMFTGVQQSGHVRFVLAMEIWMSLDQEANHLLIPRSASSNQRSLSHLAKTLINDSIFDSREIEDSISQSDNTFLYCQPEKLLVSIVVCERFFRVEHYTIGTVFRLFLVFAVRHPVLCASEPGMNKPILQVVKDQGKSRGRDEVYTSGYIIRFGTRRFEKVVEVAHNLTPVRLILLSPLVF
jgi:hypothetical protein